MVNLFRPVVQPITTRLVRQLKDDLTQIDVAAASGGGAAPDVRVTDTGDVRVTDTGDIRVRS